MRSTISLLLLVSIFNTNFSQEDSTAESTISIKPFILSQAGFSLADMQIPQDSLTYDEYVGEFIPPGLKLAHGWRVDTINGGFNKEIYSNPYIRDIRFEKQSGREMIVYRYKNGKLYTGKIEDTLILSFTPDKIKGYLSGMPYYESKEITAIFRADCINGVVQGRAVLAGNIKNLTIYKNMLLSECLIENGEMIGLSKYWDLNSINFDVSNRTIVIKENIYDYLELKKLLNYSEVTYIKGYSDWTHWTDLNGEGKVLSKKINNKKTLK